MELETQAITVTVGGNVKPESAEALAWQGGPEGRSGAFADHGVEQRDATSDASEGF